MSVLNLDRISTYRSRRKADSREYWFIFCLLYPFLLVAALIARIASLAHGERLAAGETSRSIFAEARTAAASAIPFAFK